jgi:cytochrome c oxidase cbb3-type subunit II
MYDHPFQWGSKRTGPDLARVGGRCSNEWHVEHLKDPRAVVPESNMPPYGFLAETLLEAEDPEGICARIARGACLYRRDDREGRGRSVRPWSCALPRASGSRSMPA